MGTANPASTGQARVERGKAEPAEALLWTCPCCLPPKWLASPSYYSVLLLFFFFFMAALGLGCRVQTFSSCSEQGPLFVAVHGLLIAVASLVIQHRF